MNRMLLLPFLLALLACTGQAAVTTRASTDRPAASNRPAAPSRPAAAQDWQLGASAWARPRSGAALVGMAPLPQVVRAWSGAEGEDIVILHAGGEEGELWARELRDWLIALGIPGERIRRVVGGADPHSLQLELRSSEVRQ